MTEMLVRDPALRAALFRFVDVRPACATPADVTRHLHELLEDAPGLAATPAAARSITGRRLATRPVAAIAAAGVKQMAQRFIVGEDAKDALPTITRLWRERRRRRPSTCSARRRSPRPRPTATPQRCEDALRTLAEGRDRARPGQPLASRSPRSRRCCAPRRPSAGSRARGRGCATCCASPATCRRHLHVDMESFDTREAITDLTLDLLAEPEFAHGPCAGIVLQAYLVESPRAPRASCSTGRASTRARTRSRSGSSRAPTGTTRSSRPRSTAGRRRSSPTAARATATSRR